MERETIPRWVCRWSILALMGWVAATCDADDRASQSSERPNVLWLFAEDTSPWMGCYGDPINEGKTPNIDGLAQSGVRFARAFVPAPVCSACRSAIMVGQNQIRFGAHEHRSSRGEAKIELPDGVKLLPELMKESGYFTFNLGKADYNFMWDESATYSFSHKSREQEIWGQLKDQQPFFGQIQTAGGKNNTDRFPDDRKVDPAEVVVPEDYPQNQLYREVVAQHYDAIRKDDDFIGRVLDQLEQAGLADNTIVVYFGDHGANNLVRHKQMPTEGGLHVPLIVSGPPRFVSTDSVRSDLVNLLDLSATTLAWAGVDQPTWYEGRDLFADDRVPREYVAAAKDRLDHTIDRVRSIRTDRFRYTRNYKLDRVLLQPQYRDPRPFVVDLRTAYADGTLAPKLAEIYFGERPAEELYDVQADPSQVHNLVDDVGHSGSLARHRKLLDDWLAKGDQGIGEESEAELAYQDSGMKWGTPVNPEYEVVRTDGDGDGLSSEWEKVNGRDPDDGRLLFTFDCGGWQTEGWTADPSLGNLAGRQGFLDFALTGGKDVIRRTGLRLDSSVNRGTLVVRASADGPTDLVVLSTQVGETVANEVGRTRLPGNRSMDEFTIDLSQANAWSGTIGQIELEFDAAAGTMVEIDSISVR